MPVASLLRRGFAAITLAPALLACAQDGSAPQVQNLPGPARFDFPQQGTPREIFDLLGRHNLPFEIVIPMRYRCLGGQCGIIFDPNRAISPELKLRYLQCVDAEQRRRPAARASENSTLCDARIYGGG